MKIEKFQDWYENRHHYLRNYKSRTGRKIVGYLCTYEPEELFYAADILPVRVLGGHDPANVALAASHIADMYCPFCRDVLGEVLRGHYDYIDGTSIAPACMHIRQAYSSWTIHKRPKWAHSLHMPHHVQNTKRAIPFLYEELKLLKKSLEEWIGREITNDDLRKGINIVNRDRKAMKKAFEYSKSAPPKITGLERMYISVSSFFVDKVEHAELVEDVLNELKDREIDRNTRARVMTIGGESDDIEFFKLVESCGAIVVIEEHCTSTRYFWGEVEEDPDDPLLAIAQRYVERTPCPANDWPQRIRFDRILQLARDWRVQGVFICPQAFCDTHGIEIPSLRKFLDDNNIPNYVLELDSTVPVSQFKTRVQAFLEQISGLEELF